MNNAYFCDSSDSESNVDLILGDFIEKYTEKFFECDILVLADSWSICCPVIELEFRTISIGSI